MTKGDLFALSVDGYDQIINGYPGLYTFGADLEWSTNAIESSNVNPTSLDWNTTNGGVDYGYTISGADLPQATTIDLDWASGTTVNTVIGSPIISTTTATAQGTYQLHATPAQLGTPPAGATYLLVVADPDNLVSPPTRARLPRSR